jgi:hypothetical protein
MAQSSDRENLCVLNRVGDEVFIENNPAVVHGWRIGQVLTSDLFGIPERGVEFDELTKRRREILDKAHLTDLEKRELEGLDKQLAGLPSPGSEEQILLDQIRKTAEELRKQGIIK